MHEEATRDTPAIAPAPDEALTHARPPAADPANGGAPPPRAPPPRPAERQAGPRRRRGEQGRGSASVSRGGGGRVPPHSQLQSVQPPVRDAAVVGAPDPADRRRRVAPRR